MVLVHHFLKLKLYVFSTFGSLMMINILRLINPFYLTIILIIRVNWQS